MSPVTTIHGLRTNRPVVIITDNNNEAEQLAQYLSHNNCFVILITTNAHFSDCGFVCKTLDEQMVLHAHLITFAKHCLSAATIVATAWQRILTSTIIKPQVTNATKINADMKALVARQDLRTLIINDVITAYNLTAERTLINAGFINASSFTPPNALATSYTNQVFQHITNHKAQPPQNIITPPALKGRFTAAHIVTPEPNTTETTPLLNVWFPSECEEKRVTYDPAAKEFWYRAFKRVPETIRKNELDRLYTLAPHEPRFMAQKTKLSLAVLIHGFQGWPGVYSQIARTLASIGYAVIGITNPQHAAVIQTPSKTQFQHILHKELFKSRMAEDAINNNLNDINRILKNISNSSNPLLQQLNTSNPVFIGHSLGGATAMQFTSNAHPPKMILNLDGPLLGRRIPTKPLCNILSIFSNQRTSAHISASSDIKQQLYDAYITRHSTLIKSHPGLVEQKTMTSLGHVGFTDLLYLSESRLFSGINTTTESHSEQTQALMETVSANLKSFL